MSQSAFIAAALLAGFVLYLAAKGRLATYGAVLWNPQTAAALPNPSSGPTNAATTLNPFANPAGPGSGSSGPFGDLLAGVQAAATLGIGL